MWLEAYTTPTNTVTIIVDILSHSIFPAGWCESNNYPLTAPAVVEPPEPEPSTSSSEAAQQHGTVNKTIYS